MAVANELHMICDCPALQPVRQQFALLFLADTNTMRSFFAQEVKFVLNYLDSARFDFKVCLLLHVIRLVVWLKHCHLSLSLGTTGLSLQRTGVMSLR